MDSIKKGEIISKNLSEAHGALSRKSLIYDAQIKELAYMLLDTVREEPFDGFEQIADKLRGVFSSFLSQEKIDITQMPRKSFKDIDFKIRFCALTADELSSRGISEGEIDSFDEVFDEGIRIACFSNRSADKAYEKFAGVLKGASQVICDSIAAVCEEVADGRCELCLLPIYSSADGFMQNIYRQTLRYGLSPVMSVDMPLDGDNFVRYFVFSSTLCKRQNAHTVILTVVPNDPNEIASLLSALSAYGATLEDMTSLSPSLYEGNQAFQFTFSVKNADMTRISLFLYINFPRFEINGIYEKIDTE